jgi:hydroxyacylglutathione hydrolase
LPSIRSITKNACRREGRGLDHYPDLNTHEHLDHTGGNQAMVKKTGARILAHKNARDKIADIARGLEAGDVVKVGKTVELQALDTPGHTMSHVCLLSHTDQPALFCGDTLFNAGAGNCHNGGHPAELYKTFSEQLAKLPPSTRIYPGHDYIENNLRFTLDREPDNRAAQQMLAKVGGQNPDDAYVSTLEVEREVNTFFRLTSPTVIARLREAFPDLPEQPDQRTVFLKLRELRNRW